MIKGLFSFAKNRLTICLYAKLEKIEHMGGNKMINIENFFNEVKKEFESLTKTTKEEMTIRAKKFYVERDHRIKEENEKIKQELLFKIKNVNIFYPDFGFLINAFIDNNIREYDLNFVISKIELKEQSFVPTNSYQKLEQEMRSELFSELEKYVNHTENYITIDYLRNIETFRGYKIKEDEEESFAHHFKNITLSYFKGHILKNNVKYYITEALDSVLWLIQKSKPETLQSFYLFEDPSIFTSNTETGIERIKAWYNKVGRTLTSFEELLNAEIKQGEYKNARRIFLRYGYLFDKDFKAEKEQILLQMLYDKYTDYQKTEDDMTRKHQMNEILNELIRFHPEEASSN